jgi:hypothetical protein
VCQELVNLELRVAGEVGNLTVPDVAKHFHSVLESHDCTYQFHLKERSAMVRCLSHQLVLADDGLSIRVTAHGVVGVLNSFAKLPPTFTANPIRKYLRLSDPAAFPVAAAEEEDPDEAEGAEEVEAVGDAAESGHLALPACAPSASDDELAPAPAPPTVEVAALSVPARRSHQHPLGVGVPFGGGAAAAPASGLFGGSSAGTPAAHAPAGDQIGGGAAAAAPAVLPAPTGIVSFGGGGGAAAPPHSSRMLLFENTTPPTISANGSSDVQVDPSLSLPEPEAEPKGGWPKDKANALLRQTLASLNRLSTALAAAEQANAAHQAKFEMLTAVSCAPLRSSVLLPSLTLRFTLRSLPLRLP